MRMCAGRTGEFHQPIVFEGLGDCPLCAAIDGRVDMHSAEFNAGYRRGLRVAEEKRKCAEDKEAK